MTALCPFLLVGPQPLFCLSAIKCPHEPDNLRITMQHGELVKVIHHERSQQQPFGFDQHPRSVRPATAVAGVARNCR